MADLPMGANAALPAPHGELDIVHRDDVVVDVALTAFLVAADGRVRSDDDMVFSGRRIGDDRCVSWVEPVRGGGFVRHRLAFDLDRLPPGVERIVVALSEDAGAGFARVRELRAAVDGLELPAPAFGTERGIIVAELYVRGGTAKIRANWQGYASGLAALAAAHGVEIAGAPAAPPAGPPPAPAPAPPPAPKPAPPALPHGYTGTARAVCGHVRIAREDGPVLIERTPLIEVEVSLSSWSGYDVYAIVQTPGREHHVSAVAAYRPPKEIPPLLDFRDGTVRLAADGGRRGVLRGTSRRIEIRFAQDVTAVMIGVHNTGAGGSFRRSPVSVTIDTLAGTRVTMKAGDAPGGKYVWTCVPVLLLNTREGIVVEPLELYSRRKSVSRPRLRRNGSSTTVLMDEGPVTRSRPG